MTAARIVVYGGYGVFGRRVVEDLLTHTEAEITIAGRHPRRVERGTGTERTRSESPFPRVTAVYSDLRDLESVVRTIRGAKAVILAAGPFQGLPLTVLEGAMKEGAPYLDLSDSREYVRRVYKCEYEIVRAGISAFTGLSTLPGISSVLVEKMRVHFDTLQAIRMFMSPGNRNPRGIATIQSIMTYVGRPISIVRNGNPEFVAGWSGAERVEFPAPVGERTTYFCDVPDYDLFPKFFGARTVEFRAGLELPVLNRGLEWLGRIRPAAPFVGERWFVRLMVLASQMLAGFGTPHGGLLVTVEGTRAGKGDRPRQKSSGLEGSPLADSEPVPFSVSAAVITERDGPQVPAAPAGIVAARLLRGVVSPPGIVPVHRWIHPDEFLAELRSRGISVLPVQ